MKKYTSYNTILILVLTLLTPSISYAALGGVRGLLIGVTGLLNLFIRVVFGFAVLFFFWGTGQFILNAGVEKTRNEGKQKMLWGIIALFVMVSIFGIIRFAGSALGINVDTTFMGGGSGGDCATDPAYCINM